MTNHKEFYDIDLTELNQIMKTTCIVDGRHVINPYDAIENGFTYEGIGRPSNYFKMLRRVK